MLLLQLLEVSESHQTSLKIKQLLILQRSLFFIPTITISLTMTYHLHKATQNVTMNAGTSCEPTQTDSGGNVFRQTTLDFSEICVLAVTHWCVGNGRNVTIRLHPWMTELSWRMQTAHNMTGGSDRYCCCFKSGMWMKRRQWGSPSENILFSCWAEFSG